MLPVAILAGGLATRLRPITDTIPKALVDVAGVPFVVRQLRYLHAQGVRRVVLCVSHLGERIQAVVADGSSLGLDVAYAFDGPMRLGTGGALLRALPLLGDAFFVLYGDSFLPIDFAAVEADFARAGSCALMTVLRNHDRWDKSNADYRDARVVEYNKHHPRPEMGYIDYGLSILTPATLSRYPTDAPLDLADVYHALSVAGELAGHEVFERFYEIGSHQGLAETEDYFRRQAIP
jgi:N-acetyl-alpha-D-muramate 1-phosphate uridylyltransferase